MKCAYVDTSCLVAVAFDEPVATETARVLAGYDRLFASNLLESELRSVLTRERSQQDPSLLMRGISWLMPDRPLTSEFVRVLACGYLRGADLWHLACALFLDPGASQIDLVTLDRRQGEVGLALGFAVPLQGACA